jgi:hypothetical protein
MELVLVIELNDDNKETKPYGYNLNYNYNKIDIICGETFLISTRYGVNLMM